jgi:HK97 family phage portal protein
VAQSTALERVRSAASRIFRPRLKETIGGGWRLPLGGGFIPATWPTNWWQSGHNPLPYGGSAVVYACRSAYSQTIAMCPPAHWQSDGKGGRERVKTSALSRVLRRPNTYQSPSDFFLYLTDCLYGEGAAFGLALRNARFEITEIHLMNPRHCWPRVAQNGEVFYTLAGNHVVERLFADNPVFLESVPARDVLHVRLPDQRYPLRGIPPLESALLELGVSGAMMAQALAYASNQGRPSGVLQTDASFHANPEAVRQLRASWNEQTQGVNVGGTPILTDGLKWAPAVMNSRDAQLAEMLQISDQRIATAYRVPLPLLSLMNSQGPQASTESLMAFWVSTGLGFAANHIEDAFGRLFALAGWPDDYLELDLEALLRANFKDRIAALAQGVQGGIFSPNEARAKEDLPAMPFGDEPRVQQQVVPLSAWAKAPPATPAPNAPPAAPPADGSADDGSGDAVDQSKALAARFRRRAAANDDHNLAA